MSDSHDPAKAALTGKGGLQLLDNNDADLEIRHRKYPDSFELPFLDEPSPGETLVIGYYPNSYPWFGCFSTLTSKDVKEANALIHEGEWRVTQMSDRWAVISPETPEAETE